MRPLTRAWFASALLVAGPVSGQDGSEVSLIDFATEAVGEWLVVNDGVMGGRSSSDIYLDDDGVAVFEGYLSLENNGGFASVRSRIPEGALAEASHILLRVRGDGKRYQVRLRPAARFDGVAYAAGFETTAGEWMTVALPLNSFEPTFRGYRPPSMGPVAPAQVGQIGLMLTDKQEADFRLEIRWIGFQRAGT